MIQQKELKRLGQKYRLDFIRLFGSAVVSKEKARDIDIAIGLRFLSLSERSEFIASLEKIFKKKIDLIVLSTRLSPLLIQEIGCHSIPLWEKPRSGRLVYAELMSKLMAIAEDERLSFSQKLRNESIKTAQRRLSVT